MPLDHYVTLGRSGLRVSPFCLGAMTFGNDYGWGASPEDSETLLATYLDRGGNFIDTANIYTNGHSEKIIGDFFATQNGRRHRAVIATKFFGNLYPGDPNGGGAGRKGIIDQCNESLRRLRTDYIDLYWLHNWDRTAPIEETLRAMDDLVAAGKVRYLGISDVPAWKVSQAQTITAFRGWSPLIAMQIEYSLLQRTVEGELIPMAQELGLGVMPWSPLKSGWLSGKYTRENAGSAQSARATLVGNPTEKDFVIIDTLTAVAKEAGISLATAALAWVRSRPGVASTLIGARRIEQLEENIKALEVTLTDAQIAILDDASKPVLNFPAENNTFFAPHLSFAGATVDGQATKSILMKRNATRY